MRAPIFKHSTTMIPLVWTLGGMIALKICFWMVGMNKAYNKPQNFSVKTHVKLAKCYERE